MSAEKEERDIYEGATSLPLYADDSYLKEFDASVVRSGPRFVILDRTAFYPESGGQPSDTGRLSSGQLTVRVFKVLRRGGDIFHYIEGALGEGEVVHGSIDWVSRFFNMRRHSGEHLLTGLLERAGAGPKVYSDLTRLEFQPSNLQEETLNRVEVEFNNIIKADIPVKIYYLDRDKVDSGGDERKNSFLEKIPRDIQRLRMVEIPGFALTFCFGTHVSSTGEIGRLARLELWEGKKARKIVSFALD